MTFVAGPPPRNPGKGDRFTAITLVGVFELEPEAPSLDG